MNDLIDRTIDYLERQQMTKARARAWLEEHGHGFKVGLLVATLVWLPILALLLLI